MQAPNPQLFAALADSTRLALVDRLQNLGPRSTTQLAGGTGMTRQAVRKHLGVLAVAGLVRHRRHGRERLWQLDATPLRAASEWMNAIRRHWEARLDRLDAFLTDTHSSDDETPTADRPSPLPESESDDEPAA